MPRPRWPDSTNPVSDEPGTLHYKITIQIAIGPAATDLRTPRQIEDEIRSWLSDLRAEVGAVHVRELPSR